MRNKNRSNSKFRIDYHFFHYSAPQHQYSQHMTKSFEKSQTEWNCTKIPSSSSKSSISSSSSDSDSDSSYRSIFSSVSDLISPSLSPNTSSFSPAPIPSSRIYSSASTFACTKFHRPPELAGSLSESPIWRSRRRNPSSCRGWRRRRAADGHCRRCWCSASLNKRRSFSRSFYWWSLMAESGVEDLKHWQKVDSERSERWIDLFVL